MLVQCNSITVFSSTSACASVAGTPLKFNISRAICWAQLDRNQQIRGKPAMAAPVCSTIVVSVDPALD
jgi:hypothetical protein